MPILPEIQHEVEIPEGVTVTVENGHHTIIKGPKGELDRAFRYRGVRLQVDDGKVVIHKDLPRREHKAICGTYKAHVQNMIKGVTDGWTYNMVHERQGLLAAILHPDSSRRVAELSPTEPVIVPVQAEPADVPDEESPALPVALLLVALALLARRTA